jgi:hypothetical protein
MKLIQSELFEWVLLMCQMMRSFPINSFGSTYLHSYFYTNDCSAKNESRNKDKLLFVKDNGSCYHFTIDCLD